MEFNIVFSKFYDHQQNQDIDIHYSRLRRNPLSHIVEVHVRPWNSNSLIVELYARKNMNFSNP